METRVFYFIWDDWNEVMPDENHEFYANETHILERHKTGRLVTQYNRLFIREVGYQPSPEKWVRPEPRYEPHYNTLYKPEET